MDIKELLDAIRLTCPDCGWSWLRTALMGRQHIRCPDCGMMFATFVDPAARKTRARRYVAAAYKWQSKQSNIWFSLHPAPLAQVPPLVLRPKRDTEVL